MIMQTTEEKLLQQIADSVERREDLDGSVLISATQPYILDYKSRKHIFCFSPNALTLTIEDLGSIAIPGGEWSEISFVAGMKITAQGQVTPVLLFVRCTDQMILFTNEDDIPALGQATMAASLPVVIASDQTPINMLLEDGTNIVNILPATSASNAANKQAAMLTAGAFKEVPFTTTTAQRVAVTDVSNYKWAGVQISTQGSNSLVTFEGSNDGISWFALTFADTTNNVNATLTTTGGTSLYSGPLPCRYFSLLIQGISAGTTAGIIELYTAPTALHSVGTNTTINNGAGNPVASQDPIRQRILVGQAFSATTGKQTSAGTIQTGICLFNNSTGKDILIYSIRVGIAAASVHQINLVTVDPAISGVTFAAFNSNAGNGNASVATLEAQNTAVATSGNLYDMQYCPAASSIEFLQNNTTILLPAGAANGVLVLVNTAINVWFAGLKWIEY